MTNQEAIDILIRYNAWRKSQKEKGKKDEITEALKVGIKALRDLDEAKELLNEITDYNNPGFLIPKIEKFIAEL